MTETIRQLCSIIFDTTDILRIYAEPFAYNTGSRRALEKAGFCYEGTMKNNAVKNGKALDMALYSLTRTMEPYPVRRQVYRHLGFIPTDKEQTVDGLRFTPMQYRTEENAKCQ